MTKKVSARIKGNVSNGESSHVFDLETVAQRKRKEAELKKLRLDTIRNEDITETDVS